MASPKPPIQVFEHQTLHFGRDGELSVFKEKHFNALVKLNELHDNQYFTVVHKGIKFKQFVGVIQVDDLTLEILPKIDNAPGSKNDWQRVLIEMLRITKKLDVHDVGEAHITKQNIHLLDIYFDWFLREVKLLVHQGLIKKYYRETSNVRALKGKLEFAGHIRQNIIHKERFFTTHQIYDKDHLIHRVLAKALDVVASVSKGGNLNSRCKIVQLDFPEVAEIDVNVSTFEKIVLDRKSRPYETALKIARLIILNYAPNVSSGRENMIALLFDMNLLWEEYVLARLKQVAGDHKVYRQQSKVFWKNITIRPDIVIIKSEKKLIIDTKWKALKDGKPSTDDLRQMYVYNDYWKSSKAMLLYPSTISKRVIFNSYNAISSTSVHHKCGIGEISIFKSGTTTLDADFGTTLLSWLDEPSH